MTKLISILLMAFTVSCTKATSQPVKSKFLRDHYSTHKSAGKSRGFFHITLESGAVDSEILELKATVKASQDFSDTTLEWQVPPHVEIVEGNNDHNENFMAGESKIVVLKLKVSSLKEKDQFFFFAYKMQDGERLGASTNYIYQPLTEDISDSERIHQKSQKKPKIIE